MKKKRFLSSLNYITAIISGIGVFAIVFFLFWKLTQRDTLDMLVICLAVSIGYMLVALFAMEEGGIIE